MSRAGTGLVGVQPQCCCFPTPPLLQLKQLTIFPSLRGEMWAPPSEAHPECPRETTVLTIRRLQDHGFTVRPDAG